jgi:hypothetical protein
LPVKGNSDNVWIPGQILTIASRMVDPTGVRIVKRTFFKLISHTDFNEGDSRGMIHMWPSVWQAADCGDKLAVRLDRFGKSSPCAVLKDKIFHPIISKKRVAFAKLESLHEGRIKLKLTIVSFGERL